MLEMTQHLLSNSQIEEKNAPDIDLAPIVYDQKTSIHRLTETYFFPDLIQLRNVSGQTQSVAT